MLINSIQEQYERGLLIMKKLETLKKDKLIEVMKEICSGHSGAMEVLNETSKVIKTIENDVIDEICICSWPSLRISPFGITYNPEHGEGQNVVKFGKTFTLENILK